MITGTGTTGCRITLTATVTGISPYPAITLPAATVNTHGTYTIDWHTPTSITDTLPWQLTGSEQCSP